MQLASRERKEREKARKILTTVSWCQRRRSAEFSVTVLKLRRSLTRTDSAFLSALGLLMWEESEKGCLWRHCFRRSITLWRGEKEDWLEASVNNFCWLGRISGWIIWWSWKEAICTISIAKVCTHQLKGQRERSSIKTKRAADLTDTLPVFHPNWNTVEWVYPRMSFCLPVPFGYPLGQSDSAGVLWIREKKIISLSSMLG